MIEVNFVTGHDTYDGWSSSPNSAGGVSVKYWIKNLDPKTIKYYVLRFIPYNRVGDSQRCDIRGHEQFGVRGTGPLSQNNQASGLLENAWYNHSIVTAMLTEAEIEYMDGSTEKIDGRRIQNIQSSGGCFIATSVYGSYNCPQVWTLRRYRDDVLGVTTIGRLFIKIYYKISPRLVSLFGSRKWFIELFTKILDKKINNLKQKGVKDTPYIDNVGN